MYYVIHVGSGNESKAENLIRKMVSGHLYKECFHPARHLRKRIHGTWKEIYECLIPGYIFIDSDDIHELYMELREVPVFLNIQGKSGLDEAADFYPLTESEEQWLHKITDPSSLQNEKTHIAEISQVSFDEHDQIVIVAGPLAGMEGKIKKINLHKRIAEVEVDFMNASTVLFLGIDIVEKKD